MTTLREHALSCVRAAIAAVDPEHLTHDWLDAHPHALDCRGQVHLVAIGKAAAGMVRGVVAVAGDRIARGIVIVPEGTEIDAPVRFEVYRGGHPVPHEEGVRGAQAVHDLAHSLGEDDLLLILISGGGSALMTLPPEGISLDDIRQTTDVLLHAGADIRQLNTVRKHLDRLKGGRLARAAYPARTLALVLSDVVGDRLDTIASGPVSGDPTTYEDAIQTLDQLGVADAMPNAVHDHLERGKAGEIAESPGPGDPAFERVEAHVIGNNRMAAEAAKAEAERLGYNTMILSTMITGEARHVGRVLAGIGVDILRTGTPLEPPACVIAGGETTVAVVGNGKGGRNQELALGAAIALDELLGEGSKGANERVLVASAGTDGIDGPTDAAGAVADGETVTRALQSGLDPARSLADNDVYPFFQALGDLIRIEPTGTNAMDLALVFVTQRRAASPASLQVSPG